MTLSKMISVASFAILSGCAAYELPSIAHNHPGNARAVAAPAVPQSSTLAYTRADTLALMPAAAAQEGHQDYKKSEAAKPGKTIVGEGKVIATVPSANQLVVEHGEIKGFMEAMTMGYPVEPSSLIDGLKSGEQIRFTIDVPNKTIVKIEKMK